MVQWTPFKTRQKSARKVLEENLIDNSREKAAF